MNYSESMSKRQQRRKALNQRFRRMFLVALLMGLVMGFIFGRCSAVNSKAPDAPIEPDQLTVKFICDRGVSHEIVRHRMASYCQESTRYCNYGKGKFGEEITVIEPCFWPEGSDLYWAWKNACLISEQCYFSLLKSGATPQEARSVLPNSLKTEVVMTANIREWRHFLKLRCSPAAHPQMREVALILLDKVHWLIPVCFDDIWSEYHADV